MDCSYKDRNYFNLLWEFYFYKWSFALQVNKHYQHIHTSTHIYTNVKKQLTFEVAIFYFSFFYSTFTYIFSFKSKCFSSSRVTNSNKFFSVYRLAKQRFIWTMRVIILHPLVTKWNQIFSKLQKPSLFASFIPNTLNLGFLVTHFLVLLILYILFTNCNFVQSKERCIIFRWP